MNHTPADPLRPTGSEDFDRARELFRDERLEDALDLFEIVFYEADDPSVRVSAAAHAAQALLVLDRPHEAEVWVESVQGEPGYTDLAAMLEAAVLAHMGQPEEALARLEAVTDPNDEFSANAPESVHVLRAQVYQRLGRSEEAVAEVLAALESDVLYPYAWAALAETCTKATCDLAAVVGRVPDDQVTKVMGWLANAPEDGVDLILDSAWARWEGDARVLALAQKVAPHLPLPRALEWAARLRAAGLDDRCPLIAIATQGSDPLTRVKAAAIAAATFGDEAARDLLVDAARSIPVDEIEGALSEMLVLSPEEAGSFLLGAASDGPRSLRLAVALQELGGTDEALSIAAHGLALASNAGVDLPELIAGEVPRDVAEALAAAADERDAPDVAELLRAATAPGATP